MKQSELRQYLTVVAAGFVHDHLRDGQNFGDVMFSFDDCRAMVNPGHWESFGDNHQIGGRHTYDLKCKLNRTRSHIALKVDVLMPEGFAYVSAAKFLWVDPAKAKGPEDFTNVALGSGSFSFYEPIVHRETHDSFVNQARLAARDWYKSVFDPLEDSDMGTEEFDWEKNSSLRRKEPYDSSLVVEFIRMRNRKDESFDDSFLDPGIVEVNIISDNEIKVRWKKQPRGAFAMSKPDMPANYGGWE